MFLLSLISDLGVLSTTFGWVLWAWRFFHLTGSLFELYVGRLVVLIFERLSPQLVHPLTSEGIVKEPINCSNFCVVYLSVIESSHTMCVHQILVLNHYCFKVLFFLVGRCLMFVLLGIESL